MAYQGTMRVFDHYDELDGQTPTAVAIGNFDGVHRGHLALLGRTTRYATERGLIPAVLTFEPHPVRVLAPHRAPPLIVDRHDKIALLGAAGIEWVLAQRFDRVFAGLSPGDFAERVLHGGLCARAVVVGYDFNFGARRAGDADTLRDLGEALGFTVHVVAPQTAGGEHVASSSRVREAVRGGDMAQAAAVLGRPFHLRGAVVKGHQRGREMGFPTANLEVTTDLPPATGIYAGWLDWGEGPRPTAVNIGYNPTFGDGPRTIEAHVIDAPDLNLYGRTCRLWLERRTRGEVRFASLAELRAAIDADVAGIRAWLARRSPPALP